MQDVISLGIGEPDFITPEKCWKRVYVHYEVVRRTILPIQAGWTTQALSPSGGSLPVSYDPIMKILKRSVYGTGLPGDDVHSGSGDEVIIPTPCLLHIRVKSYSPGVYRWSWPARWKQFDLDTKAWSLDYTTYQAILLGFPIIRPEQWLTKNTAGSGKTGRKTRPGWISDELYDRLVYGVEHVCSRDWRICVSAPSYWRWSKTMP